MRKIREVSRALWKVRVQVADGVWIFQPIEDIVGTALLQSKQVMVKGTPEKLEGFFTFMNISDAESGQASKRYVPVKELVAGFLEGYYKYIWVYSNEWVRMVELNGSFITL